MSVEKLVAAQQIFESELEALCLRDEAMVREAMGMSSTARKRVVVLPDLDHMLWHIRKEDFATNHIFDKTAEVKGAIAGSPGTQVWAIWVRRYYSHPDHRDDNEDEEVNILYILRLVVEGDETAKKPHEDHSPTSTDNFKEHTAALKAVIQAAQVEAAESRLDQVQMWEPSPLVRSLLAQSDLDPIQVE